MKSRTAQILPFQPAINATPGLTEGAVAVTDITKQYDLIVQAMKQVMKEGEHYGTIPGCGDKKTLKKPGAEVLLVLFGLSTDVIVSRFDMPNSHREVECKITVFAPSGRQLGTGVGSCSTMESKYRFRTGPSEITGKLVPQEYWNVRGSDPKKARDILGGKGFVPTKGDDGQWHIAIQGERVENDNPADQYNTVLKVGKKRALIDGVLNSTAASFLFTQDLDDMLENGIIPIQAEDITPEPVDGQPPGNAEKIPPTNGKDPSTGNGENKTHQGTIPTPDKILVALARKNITHSTNEAGKIFVKLSYGDTGNRQFVSELGFKWNPSDKMWVFNP